MPSHSSQGNLIPLRHLEPLLSLVDGKHSTWLSEVDASELCKRGDQSLSIRGIQGHPQWSRQSVVGESIQLGMTLTHSKGDSSLATAESKAI